MSIRLHLLLSTILLFLSPVAGLASALAAIWTLPIPHWAAWPLILAATAGSFLLVDHLSRRVFTPRCLRPGCAGRYRLDRNAGERIVYSCAACGDRQGTALHWGD